MVKSTQRYSSRVEHSYIQVRPFLTCEAVNFGSAMVLVAAAREFDSMAGRDAWLRTWADVNLGTSAMFAVVPAEKDCHFVNSDVARTGDERKHVAVEPK